MAERQLDLSLPAEGGIPATSVGLTTVAVAASAVREIRVADAALRARIAAGQTPALFNVDERAARRFWEFFVADLRNANTRAAYLAAVYRFADWCEARGLQLATLEPVAMAAYDPSHVAVSIPCRAFRTSAPLVLRPGASSCGPPLPV